MPIGPMGQSAFVVQVGMHKLPMGVCPHVQPFDPGGQSVNMQSAGVMHDFGPIIIPPSPGGGPPSGMPMPPPIAVPRKQPKTYGNVSVTW